jgi:predicted esterase
VRLRDAMHAAGAHVTWLEYPGGHEIAPVAAAAAADFLARLISAAWSSPAR